MIKPIHAGSKVSCGLSVVISILNGKTIAVVCEGCGPKQIIQRRQDNVTLCFWQGIDGENIPEYGAGRAERTIGFHVYRGNKSMKKLYWRSR